MTLVNDPIERYLRAVESRILAGRAERERLLTDLRDHLESVRADGVTSWSDLVDRMGPPEEVAAAYRAENPLDYAGLLPRTVAFFGDMGILGLVSLPALVPMVLVVRWAESGVSDAARLLSVLAAVAVGFAVFVAWVLYFPLFEAHSGKTPAKHWMGLRVLRESGEPIGAGQAFLRRLSFFFELLVVDALFVPFTERKQRALDLLVHTVVVREPDRDPSPLAWVACLFLPVLALAAVVAGFVIFGAG